MNGGQVRLVEDGDALDVDDENELRRAVNRLLALKVDPSTMSLAWMGGVPVLGAATPLILMPFRTTSAITTSSISGSTLTYGGGTARRCIKSGKGVGSTLAPDADAADDTILNGVVVTSSIASGKFVWCARIQGEWVVILVAQCS